ncbi:MAG: hypothetical protein JWM68_195 [Verrucomicrobiales bacterium]|nr:hypothetical protein [Verrucomicrobiales bacterium]
MHGKKWVLVAVFLIGGIVLTSVGLKALLTGKKLEREGKTTVATIVSRDSRPLYKKQLAYYLTLGFETEAKEKITQEIMVLHPEFARTEGRPNVTIHYLPSDPNVIMLDPIEIRWGQIVTGSIFALFGAVLLVIFVRNPKHGNGPPITQEERIEHARETAADSAVKIVQQLKPLTVSQHEYEMADPSRFRHLDLAFYNDTQKFLESSGFGHLEDVENVTLRNSANNPNTFIRVMLGANGTIMADIYQFKPSAVKRLLGMKEFKVLDLETQFSNGCFVCTNNAETAGALSQPTEVDSLNMAAVTPFSTLLDAHRKRVELFSQSTGVPPLRLQTVSDVRKAQDALQCLKAAHRQKTGLTRTEIANLGGGQAGTKEVDMAFEAILKEHGKHPPKK